MGPFRKHKGRAIESEGDKGRAHLTEVARGRLRRRARGKKSVSIVIYRRR
jgi:hypothetical protein